MNTKNQREFFLDLLRIIACFLVIVNHTNSSIFLNGSPQDVSWFLSLSYFFVSKIAVPIFFMISGYLLLNKIDTWKKVLSRFLRILVVLICCAIAYSVYYNIYVNSNTSLFALIKRIISVYKDSPSNAFWYLYAYLGILLMLPFLQKMVQLMTKRDYHIFFVISGTIFGILPILNHYFDKITRHSKFYLPLFGGYICLLLLGQYFSRFGIKKSKSGFCFALITFILMVSLNVLLTFLEYKKSNDYYLFFDNITYLPIILESVCIFYMASFAKFSQKASAVISYIGSCTFGIYLISDMSIDFLRPIYTSLCFFIHPLIAVVLFELLVFFIGFGITILLKKIPFVKKYL